MAANEIFNDLNLVLQVNQHIQAASATASSSSKHTSFKVLNNLESVSYSESREDAQFDHQRSTFLSASSSDLPFHLQGDRDFNEASVMAKRRALRFSEAVKTRIEFLWEVAGGKIRAEMAQRVHQQQRQDDERARRQSVRRPTAVDGVKQLLPPVAALDEQDYMALMLLVFKVLRDDFVLENAHKQIQCDWEVDSHHGKTLSFDQFFAAVFELVDVWTCDVEEVTYERFLHLLALRITQRVAIFMDGAELKLSLSDNFEPDVVVKAIPLRTVPKFVSVARVVAALGVTTVGDLARADPKIVEKNRIDFIQRNNGGVVPNGLSEMRKIGQDLQTLLEMFKSIALQFENINYVLDNNVLRRLPKTAAASRQQPEESSMEPSDTNSANWSHSEQVSASGDIYVGTGINDATCSFGSVPVGTRSLIRSGNLPSKSDAKSRQTQSTVGNENFNGSSMTEFTQNPDTKHGIPLTRDSSSAHNFENARADKRDASVPDSRSPNLHPQANTGARGASESSAGFIQPINSIYELQSANTDVVNALRSTFLIEKAISIERQTELPSIREELVKFGVGSEVTKFAEDTVRDRYNALYDLLVLRDGESLKSLAAVMLEQIKLELSKHGIIVNDEEAVEEVYDGFYASVVTGTGDSIVEEAQRWMEDTVQDNKVNDYIQHDFHELKSIDEVNLLGSNLGDEEFLSLLAKDDDKEDEVVVDTGKTITRKSSSLIQRKLSRAVTVSIPSPVDTFKESQSRLSEPVEELLPQRPMDPVSTPVNDEVDHNIGDKKKKKKAKKKKKVVEPQSSSHTSASSFGSVDSRKSPPPTPVEDGNSSNSDHHKEKPITKARKPKLLVTTQAQAQDEVVENNVVDQTTSLGPPIEATDAVNAVEPDDTNRNKPPLPSRHGRPNTELHIDTAVGEKNHRDISEQHTARDALNVAIELEVENIVTDTSARVDVERPISLEPKMPKIAIGGSASAKNVPVTGRYIQLLGLGTVLITKDERDFFQLLRSHESLDTDLVCFDIGTDLDTALSKLQTIQQHVGNRVILFGGNTDEPERTQQVALECLAHGALYFATIPFNFPRLRERIMSFFENSKQPYILRQRKPPGQTAQMGSSIGTGSLFALHDEPRRVSTSVAFAKTPRRKVAVATPALPSLSHSPREISQSFPQGLSEPRHADFTPIAPSTPRSSQSRNRSPRFSTALNKLIR
ncbi:hypothetical protein L914_07162 [Phytophthora nicotianae]|uniref:Uncharacterized protein n=2 Tax=Phytophthora nicotianae TaxID=4792 RepID=W2NI31_PHYNI|nr:hypothetical protein L914_07162 [Phytophthora nicotianae]ETO77337.1 hypothetical protein F444_07462 [Phytophthora nicotianae P1976]